MLILLALIAGIAYLSVLAYGSSKISYFRRSVKRRLQALAVIYSQKRNVLLALSKSYADCGIVLSGKDEEAITKVRWLLTDTKDREEALAAEETLNALEKRLSFLSATNPFVDKGHEIALLKETLGELEFNLRRIVAGYNSDVLGYNYWRAFWPYRYIYFLCRLPYLKQLS